MCVGYFNNKIFSTQQSKCLHHTGFSLSITKLIISAELCDAKYIGLYAISTYRKKDIDVHLVVFNHNIFH